MTTIFGPNFKASEKYANKTIEMMVSKDVLSPDGMIKTEKIPLIHKSDLWGYIFYIWFHNKDAFENIKTQITFRNDVQEWVVKFLKSTIKESNLQKYVNEKDTLIYLTKIHLIMFVHYLVMMPNIKIPVLKALKTQPKELMDRLIEEEERKYNKMIEQLEEHINNPKVTILEDSTVKVQMTLRQK